MAVSSGAEGGGIASMMSLLFEILRGVKSACDSAWGQRLISPI